MNKRFSLRTSAAIVFSFLIIAIGVVVLFQNHFQREQIFTGDKRVEEIYEHNFTLTENEARDIASKYITEERAIDVAISSGLDKNYGWITSFHYISNPDYDYVWAVTGSDSTEKVGGVQVIIDAKTEEIISTMNISFD